MQVIIIINKLDVGDTIAEFRGKNISELHLYLKI